jgi:DNA-binding response OmpR family regulator
MENEKILVVDDEPKILKIIEHSLHREGYQVFTATDGLKALSMAEKIKPNLIILDLMLPKMDGYEVCKRIKSTQDVPVIILSARGEEVDKVVGFTLGADDYQTKPFSPTELAMRVKAVLRRCKKHNQFLAGVNHIEFNGMVINSKNRSVRVNDKHMDLTAKEFNLLWFLASGAPQVFTRHHLLEALWEPDFCGDENTLTVHIRRLREKIEVDSNKPKYIKTVWGVGYKFEVENESDEQK